jgi:hypothetical protein
LPPQPEKNQTKEFRPLPAQDRPVFLLKRPTSGSISLDDS